MSESYLMILREKEQMLGSNIRRSEWINSFVEIDWPGYPRSIHCMPQVVTPLRCCNGVSSLGRSYRGRLQIVWYSQLVKDKLQVLEMVEV